MPATSSRIRVEFCQDSGSVSVVETTYVGSNDGSVYAFPTRCGTSGARCDPAWIGRTGGPIRQVPVIANGVVYASSTDGKLYAFPESWPGQQARSRASRLSKCPLGPCRRQRPCGTAGRSMPSLRMVSSARPHGRRDRHVTARRHPFERDRNLTEGTATWRAMIAPWTSPTGRIPPRRVPGPNSRHRSCTA